MEENKDLVTSPEAETEVEKEKKEKKSKKEKKVKKEKLLKNTLFAKKGSYSIVLTAIVLVGIIVINVLVTALSERFVLEFDMTADKVNSISEENIEYIKSVDKEVEIIVCATEDTYAGYVGAMAQQTYSVTYDAASNEYFEQTVKLIKRYNDYNDKINVRFVDTQSSEFNAVASTYGTDNLEYGSIIVSTDKADGSKRYKKLSFKDIYSLYEDQTYASYGMVTVTVEGNDIETALTSAVAYALSDIDTKVALLTGHSSADMTSDYKTMLEKNNYEVEVISDSVINKISDEYDIIVLPAPTKDFIESELNAIAEFLDNDKELGKGLMVFADANAAYLEGLYSYLAEWGIEISDGVLYETEENYHVVDDPTTFISQNTGEISELADMQLCITGNNVAMKTAFEEDGYRATTVVVKAFDSAVMAPKGTTAGWAGAENAEKGGFATVIESVHTDYNDDNDEITSRVTVFGSSYFLTSDFNETASVSNKNLSLAMTDRAANVGDTGISFVSKSITNESYYESVTEGSAAAMRIIFMLLLPIAVLVLGTVIFIKRRNA